MDPDRPRLRLKALRSESAEARHIADRLIGEAHDEQGVIAYEGVEPLQLAFIEPVVFGPGIGGQ